MKKITLTLLLALMLSGIGAFAQKSYTGGHGHTLKVWELAGITDTTIMSVIHYQY
jgi:hypothetical protein